MQMTASSEQMVSSLMDLKMKALLNNEYTVHCYRYSHEIHGYIFQIHDEMHIVLNSEKSKAERLKIKYDLIRLAIEHHNSFFVLMHGKKRKVVTSPYPEKKMEINIFELSKLVENIDKRGVQENGC